MSRSATGEKSIGDSSDQNQREKGNKGSGKFFVLFFSIPEISTDKKTLSILPEAENGKNL